MDNKLASFQKALTDQQATWELAQDRKLQDLKASQQEFQAQARQEFQNVHDTAAYQASGSHGPDGFDDGGVAGSWAHGGEEAWRFPRHSRC